MTDIIIFVSLAKNQSAFFAALEPHLHAAGKEVAHICFHEGAAAELKDMGRRVFNPFSVPEGNEIFSFEDYKVSNPALLIAHEKAAYEVRSTKELLAKLRRHLAAVEAIMDSLSLGGRSVVVVQELGGFTSVLASFLVARRRGISNYFIEPSFFKGRFFLTRDSFAAPQIPRASERASDEVLALLNNIRVSQSVVVPVKDKLHYRNASKKLWDLKNWRRLIEKIFQKYVLRQQEEFEHISGHVWRHIRMALNSARLSKFYQNIPISDPFIYYPLHVPADFALTVRSPEYLDQLSLIDFLCRVIPTGRKLVIKEHPALIGALSASRLRALFRRHDNLVLLSPNINNHRVLRSAEAVITVNSKAGAEALLYNRPVFALGDSFYRDSGLVTSIKALGELKSCLQETGSPSTEGVNNFLQDVWLASSKGELYDLDEQNIEIFSRSLLNRLCEN